MVRLRLGRWRTVRIHSGIARPGDKYREEERRDSRTTVTEGDGLLGKVARLLARVSKVHALRGTPWERHSGQTDTDIETRLPTIC